MQCFLPLNKPQNSGISGSFVLGRVLSQTSMSQSRRPNWRKVFSKTIQKCTRIYSLGVYTSDFQGFSKVILCLAQTCTNWRNIWSVCWNTRFVNQGWKPTRYRPIRLQKSNAHLQFGCIHFRFSAFFESPTEAWRKLALTGVTSAGRILALDPDFCVWNLLESGTLQHPKY